MLFFGKVTRQDNFEHIIEDVPSKNAEIHGKIYLKNYWSIVSYSLTGDKLIETDSAKSGSERSE